MNLMRAKNKLITRLSGWIPALSKKLVAGYAPVENGDIPWTAVSKPLAETTVALVTTAGIHHRDQKPFDMADPNGDPSFRIIRSDTIPGDYIITHDYYDHRDADRDINVVFPVQRLQEMADAGAIGNSARRHYSFMGHIDGPHIRELIRTTAPAVAAHLVEDGVGAVILTPG